jgi:small GTP-binding protein
MVRTVKVVVVGDGNVGKTCLLWSYVRHEIPPSYVPTVFDNHLLHLQYKNSAVNLQLWDTTSQEELDSIRALSYSKTDVFLICFSLADPDSLANVQSKWLPEIKRHVKDPCVIVIGTKKDLRADH